MNRVCDSQSLRATCSRFFPVAAILACLLLGACQQRQDVYSYDPKVDSILPPPVTTLDMTILDDQKSRPRPNLSEATPPASAPAAATAPAGGAPTPEPAAATAPATPGAPATVPPPPPIPE